MVHQANSLCCGTGIAHGCQCLSWLFHFLLMAQVGSRELPKSLGPNHHMGDPREASGSQLKLALLWPLVPEDGRSLSLPLSCLSDKHLFLKKKLIHTLWMYWGEPWEDFPQPCSNKTNSVSDLSKLLEQYLQNILLYTGVSKKFHEVDTPISGY